MVELVFPPQLEQSMRIEDIFSNLPTLETSRLVLRKLAQRDLPDLFEFTSDPEVTRYLSWAPHTSMEETRHYLNSILERYRQRLATPWGIVHCTDQKLIGLCGYRQWTPEHARAELAYLLARPYWGRGLTSEAAGAALGFGFETLKLNRIEGTCRPENDRSARVMEKLQMRLEGTLRQHLFARGAFHDLKLYAILREEYERTVATGAGN